MNAYDIGDLAHCAAVFTTAADVAVDPAAVFCSVTSPSGVTTVYTYGTDAELVKAAVGNYYIDVPATLAGRWNYRFFSTGTGQAAIDGQFYVMEAPSSEPISLVEAKEQLRVAVDLHDDDAIIGRYIKAARIYCEQLWRRAFITQTWDFFLDRFPGGYTLDRFHRNHARDQIELPLPPLQSVTWVRYKDHAGVLQTFGNSPALYIVDVAREPGRIVLASNQQWPQTLHEIQAVQIRFVCGYGGANDVPENMRQGVLLKLGDLYEHRGDEAVDPKIETAIENLAWQDRITRIGTFAPGYFTRVS